MLLLLQQPSYILGGIILFGPRVVEEKDELLRPQAALGLP
jgi:hypothetical protein